MARPESTSDLEKTVTQVAHFNDVRLHNLTKHQVDAIIAAKEALTAAFLYEVSEAGITFWRRMSAREQARLLEHAQRIWDDYKRQYKAALNGRGPQYNFERQDLDAWAQKEGLNAIDWDYVDALDAAEAEETGE